MKVYTVTGKFVIPGTTTSTTFATKVSANSISEGSRMLASTLQKQFHSRIPKGFVFPKDFALMNFNWESKDNQLIINKIESEMIHSI